MIESRKTNWNTGRELETAREKTEKIERKKERDGKIMRDSDRDGNMSQYRLLSDFYCSPRAEAPDVGQLRRNFDGVDPIVSRSLPVPVITDGAMLSVPHPTKEHHSSPQLYTCAPTLEGISPIFDGGASSPHFFLVLSKLPEKMLHSG